VALAQSLICSDLKPSTFTAEISHACPVLKPYILAAVADLRGPEALQPAAGRGRHHQAGRLRAVAAPAPRQRRARVKAPAGAPIQCTRSLHRDMLLQSAWDAPCRCTPRKQNNTPAVTSAAVYRPNGSLIDRPQPDRRTTWRPSCSAPGRSTHSPATCGRWAWCCTSASPARSRSGGSCSPSCSATSRARRRPRSRVGSNLHWTVLRRGQRLPRCCHRLACARKLSVSQIDMTCGRC
jgi:hypothetical protein